MDAKKENSGQKADLGGVLATRRVALQRLIAMGAYVVPAVASFSMSALYIDGFMHTAAAS